MSLFSQHVAPLAERSRPDSLESYVGQEHIAGPDGIVRRMIETNRPMSLILWGGPGCGKTTLARIISDHLNLDSYYMSAMSAGVADVRKVIDTGRKNRAHGVTTLLFLDEIHRFNKAQQDSVLQAVESGDLVLIGATTENPSFSIIAPLLSRARVLKLELLSEENLKEILARVMKHDSYLSSFTLEEQAQQLLLASAGGDARKMLNLLESLASQSTAQTINADAVKKEIEHASGYYDRSGDRHYDTISAFIKSVRGSDPDAAVYYLARMLSGGEDPVFIARRLVILASEDIGNASPQALNIAVSAMQACQQIGMPEARIILSQCTTFLACSPKSNAAYTAINAALEDVKFDSSEIPMHIRNAPTTMMREMGYSEGYIYPHDVPGSFSGQDYFPENREKVYYDPTEHGSEKAIRSRLRELRPKRYTKDDTKKE